MTVRPAKTQITDQSLRCPHEETLGPYLFIECTAKTLIRLGGFPCWSESSLGTQSLCWFCHVTAQIFMVVFSYCKTLKNLDTRKNYCNYPKIWLIWIFHRVMGSKDADRIANSVASSVDPDQPALGLHCLARHIGHSVDSDPTALGLHCLPRPICLKTEDHYGRCNFRSLLTMDYRNWASSREYLSSGFATRVHSSRPAQP